MLFMVIERFRDNDMIPVYQRVRDSGRSLPDGLEFVDSWVEPSFARCFQLMRCDDLRLLQAWVLSWRGTGVTFGSCRSSPAPTLARSWRRISDADTAACPYSAAACAGAS